MTLITEINDICKKQLSFH